MKISMKEKLEDIFLAPFARMLDVSPNYVTAASIAFMAVAAYLVAARMLPNAAVFFAASCLLDALDGMVARINRAATKFGFFFDRTADRINDALIIGALAYVGYVSLELGLLTLAVVMLASYMSSVIEGLKKDRIGERLSLRYVRMTAIFLGLIIPHPLAPQYAMFAVLATGVFGVATRFYAAKRVLRGR